MNNLKLSLITLACAGAITSASAQNVELSERLVNNYQQAIAHAHDHSNHRGTCLTPIFMEARRNWNQLTSSAQQTFGRSSSRPTLSGSAMVHSTTNFDIHFTTSGADAVPSANTNGNSTIDYIETVATVLENVYQDEVVARGYTSPPSDAGTGGSSRYDVYITGLGAGLYGFVAGENTIGDNPNSGSITETSANTSWMNISNDYSWQSNTLEDVIGVTIAHEYFHSIQFGYDTDNMTAFFAEATATALEEFVYPGVDDNFSYMAEVFQKPDVAMNYNQNDGSIHSGIWYSNWVFFKHLTEHTNNPIIKKIMERMITEGELASIDNELKAEWSSDLSTAFKDYVIAKYALTTAVGPYSLNRAPDYKNHLSSGSPSGSVTMEGAITFASTPVTWDSETQGNSRLMRLGADYVGVNTTSPVSITLQKGNESASLRLLLIKHSSLSGILVEEAVVSGSSATVMTGDPTGWTNMVAVVIRDDWSTSSTSETYTLTVQAPPAGIDENDISEFNVYPNPASDQIKFELTGSAIVKDFTVYDMLGKQVIQDASLLTNNSFVDISTWKSGSYIAKITTSDNKSYFQKIVKSEE